MVGQTELSLPLMCWCYKSMQLACFKSTANNSAEQNSLQSRVIETEMACSPQFFNKGDQGHFGPSAKYVTVDSLEPLGGFQCHQICYPLLCIRLPELRKGAAAAHGTGSRA